MVEAAHAESFRDARELADVTKILLENKPLNQETADSLKSLSERVALELQEQAEHKADDYPILRHLDLAKGWDNGTNTESDPE